MDKGHKGLSVRKQADMLEVSRSSLYYTPVGESEENLEIMRLIVNGNEECSDFGNQGCSVFGNISAVDSATMLQSL